MLSGPVAEAVSIAVLVAVLAFAVIRPRGLPEVVVALPGAVLLLAGHAVTVDHARDELARLASVVGFLAAILVLARLCESEGLFRAFGARLSRAADGNPSRLLAGVFVLAALTTAALSLDATVVLLTPVVFVTAGRLGVRPKPYLYACGHLSNTASLLFPVSNLTNLLALGASGLGFARFSLLMALPWLVAIAAEYVVFRWFFATDLAAAPEPRTPDPGPVPLPRVALAVVVATLAGCAVASAAGIDPVWAAITGAVVLAGHALAGRRTTPATVLRGTSPFFLVFVLALAVVVRAVVDNGLGHALGGLLPGGSGLLQLLLLAGVAALLANLINNLPAVLVLLPLVAPTGPAAVLAVLLGVDLGPNLAYPGSLATLLWRRVLREHRTDVAVGEFTRLGLVSVPVTLVLAVAALWLSIRLAGG